MKSRESSSNLVVFRAGGQPWGNLLLSLWQFRTFIGILCWRDLKVRYKQTALGIAWVILIPFVSMVVFSLIFGGLAKIPSDGHPYPIFVFSGLLIWQLFAKAFSDVSQCLTNNLALIKKVFFPRMALPVAGALPGIVDFVCGLGGFFVLVIYYGVSLRWGWVVLPVFVLIAVWSAFAVGLWLATLNASYRDVQFLLPFMSQLWFFGTPVVYPLSLVPMPWQPLMFLNPMTTAVVGVRWAILGSDAPPVFGVALSIFVLILVSLGGIWTFRRFELGFADRL